MIRNARIRSVDGRNDAGQYVYDAEWSDDGCPCTLRYVAAPGRYESYLVDDVVMVALPYGDHTAGRIIGLYESSQLEPANDGNTEVQARGDKAIVLRAETIQLGQDADKGIAREDDEVEITITAGSFIVSVAGGSGAPATGTLNPTDITFTGRITSASATAKAVD